MSRAARSAVPKSPGTRGGRRGAGDGGSVSVRVVSSMVLTITHGSSRGTYRVIGLLGLALTPLGSGRIYPAGMTERRADVRKFLTVLAARLPNRSSLGLRQ